MTATRTGSLTIADVRHRFADAFRPRASIYWSDLLATTAVCWAALAVSAGAPLGSPVHLASTLIAMLALFRAAIFVHEIAHQRRGALPGFELAWNVLVGVPFLAPSLTYVGSHLDHHRLATFGTWSDPEYLPLSRSTPLRHLGFLLVPAVEVPMFPLRWGLLGPASWVLPPLRRWVVERASTLALNPRYRRPAPQGRDTVRWMAQETAAGAFVWLVAAAVVAGWISVQWLLQWYLVIAGALILNQARNLAAHRYESDGRPARGRSLPEDSAPRRHCRRAHSGAARRGPPRVPLGASSSSLDHRGSLYDGQVRLSLGTGVMLSTLPRPDRLNETPDVTKRGRGGPFTLGQRWGTCSS